MSELVETPASLYRGGTSKALMLNAADLPCKPGPQLDQWILAALGSPDPLQLDGVGGGRPATSKMAIISKSKRNDADVDFTMAVVKIHSSDVDWSQNCGNIISAVGPFAIDQGLFSPNGRSAKIRIYNTNTNAVIVSTFKLDSAQNPKVFGRQSIDGVPGTGAPIELDFSKSAGGATGKLFPTGSPRDSVVVNSHRYEYSLIDFANLMAFLPATAFGLTGNENPADLNNDSKLLKTVEQVRGEIAFRVGLASSAATAFKETSGMPYLLLVSKPKAWHDNKILFKPSSCDFMLRAFCTGTAHATLPGTASVCAGVGARIKNTILSDFVTNSASQNSLLRLGHPQGIIEVESRVKKKDGTWWVKEASIVRTARKLMTGIIYVPANYANKK